MNLAAHLAMSLAWAMEEPALRQLFEIAAREHEVTPQALEAYRAKSLEKGEQAKLRDGVAILNMDGPLFKRGNLFTEMSGATSYDVLRRDLQAALDDGNVKAILFNIDSPGGEAAGCAELAAAIYAARGQKPMIAYAGDLMASAAYWIGSAADRIVIGQSAAVGSIGVRASIADTSARDARAGVQRFEFVSSQSPYKVADPKTEDGAARLQSRVDALAAVFVDTVAVNRDVSSAHVLDAFGKGDVLIGAAAVAAGMADEIGTFESVLAELSRPVAFAPTRPLAAKPAPILAADRAFEAIRAAAAARETAEKATEEAAAERRYQAARAAAQARADAEKKAAAVRAEEDVAVATILDARARCRGRTSQSAH